MPRELVTGTKIAEYEIKRVLGQGGFGITYLAHDENLARDVAIKEYFPRQFAHREAGFTIIPNQDDQDRADFEWGMKHFVEEARSLTRFRHKNIVGAIRFIRENGTAYLVMEYCDGESLESLAKRSGPLAADVVVPILNQLLDGLEEVHRSRLLHLDIKPSNIFVKQDGTVVLLDFGSVRQAISSHTKSVMVGSPGYAAPEQGSDDVDARARGPWTDIYGLGATLYRLVTGSRPQEATARLIQDRLLPVPDLTDRGYGRGYGDAINASLRLNPHQRLQSIKEFREMVSPPLSPITPTPESVDRGGRPPISNLSGFPWAPFSVACAVVLILIAIAIAGKNKSLGNEHKTADSQPTELSTDDPPTTTYKVDLTGNRSRPAEPEGSGESIQPESSDNAVRKIGPGPCPQDQGFKEFEDGTLAWNDCVGTISKGGYKFTGLWRDGKKVSGIEVLEDKTRYEGAFRENLWHGEGKAEFADGSRFEGTWRKGQLVGRGVEIDKAGNRYVGNFERGWRNGQGTLYLPNGDKFTGLFVDGQRSGLGTYIWKSGDKFYGTYAYGLANGQGTYTWANGSKFVGMYVDGKENGPGAIYNAEGTLTYSGVWVNGVVKADSGTPGSSGSATGGVKKNLYIDVKNSTSYAINYIYVKTQSSYDWGNDRLGQRTLSKGETFRVQLPGSVETVFDLRACDGDRDEYVISRVNAETSNAEFKLDNLSREKCK